MSSSTVPSDFIITGWALSTAAASAVSGGLQQFSDIRGPNWRVAHWHPGSAWIVLKELK